MPIREVPRYLGLDIGSKRIGVAVSDELGLLAQPVMTLTRKRNPREDMRSLARVCRKFGCFGIVAGDPLHMSETRSGEVSAQAVKTRAFAEELGKLAALPVHLVDERLTSRAAHEILYAAGKSRQEHKPLVDQVAAVLILQTFLDARREAALRSGLQAETPEAPPNG
ncbi:MAG TPA: Holliday junction resolvase RuvX [Acidobacteriaceae bacterium]|nr:Holliday junction resolvase RuvX [Acidobacteriaceae bacterium]